MSPTTTTTLVLVALGGAVGSGARWALNRQVSSWVHGPTSVFPWGILVINVLGSLAIGVLAAGFAHHWLHAHGYTLLATGVCGGFTTFSTFSLDNLTLLQDGRAGLAFTYMAASLAAGLGAVAAGWYVTSAFSH